MAMPRTPASAHSFRGYNFKRADSVPQSPMMPKFARTPTFPPTPGAEALPSYTWDVSPPSPATLKRLSEPSMPVPEASGWPQSPKSPQELQRPESPKSPTKTLQMEPISPVLSRSETFVNESAIHGGDEGKGGPIGRTYIFRVIPSRIGVAFIASLMFVCSISMAVGASLIANRLDGQLTPVQRLAIIFQILNYLFVTLASLVGLYALLSILHRNAISPLSRARKACQLFCGLLLGHLPFSIASGALSIHIVFKATTRALRAGIETAEKKAVAESAEVGARALWELVKRSGHEATGPDAKPLACWVLEGTPLYWICTKTQLIKGLVVVLYLALWFLEVVALYAGTRYSAQLHSVEMIKNVEDEEAADY